MSAVIQVTPKAARHLYKGHTIILTFRPNAFEHERWSWLVRYTRIYEFVGNNADMGRALREAKKAIDNMGARNG